MTIRQILAARTLVQFLILIFSISVKAQNMAIVRDIDFVPSIQYDNNKDKLDIYAPKEARKAPVLLFYHGGGLVEGDKNEMEFAAGRFVSEGIVVVFANYRLSPGVTHPAHMEDAAQAFAWVKENISEYGGNPNKVFISGHSAGGYLAVLLGMDDRYMTPYNFQLKDVSGVIGVSPYLYVEETARVRDKSIWGTDTTVWKSASVSPYISNKKPPMLLLYADGDDDWRKRHNETLAKALRKEGNSNVQVYEVTNRDHGSLWGKINEKGDRVSTLMVSFITKK